MIRKLYTLLLIGLCLNLVACSDDNDNIDRMLLLRLLNSRWNN